MLSPHTGYALQHFVQINTGNFSIKHKHPGYFQINIEGFASTGYNYVFIRNNSTRRGPFPLFLLNEGPLDILGDVGGSNGDILEKCLGIVGQVHCNEFAFCRLFKWTVQKKLHNIIEKVKHKEKNLKGAWSFEMVEEQKIMSIYDQKLFFFLLFDFISFLIFPDN